MHASLNEAMASPDASQVKELLDELDTLQQELSEFPRYKVNRLLRLFRWRAER